MDDRLNFNGLILAGGRSRRMGRDKAGLIWRGNSLLIHAKNLLQHSGADQIIISGKPGGLIDPITNTGPLSGICALHTHVIEHGLETNWVIIPVDMPFLTTDLIKRLIRTSGPAVCFEGRPLPMVLRFNQIEPGHFQTALTLLQENKGHSLREFLQSVLCVSLTPDAKDLKHLANVNTLAEFTALQGTGDKNDN